MREILFRGKRKDNGEWVEGFYGEFHNRPFDPRENICQIFEPREDAYLLRSSVGGLWHTIDRETLGQFTGLTDKNGKKIFEGDCINHPFNVVEFADGVFCVAGDRLLYDVGKNGEVIGNIHDKKGTDMKSGEYIKKSDAERVLEELKTHYSFALSKVVVDACINKILSMPATVSVEPVFGRWEDVAHVVRCKDCKRMNEDKFCVAWEGFVRENDFCSCEERK